MALIEDGRKRMGERVHAVVRGRAFAARVVPPVFFDPQGARLNG